MAVRKPAAIGIERKWAAGSSALTADESAALAATAEAQRLQGHNHGDGERVVNLGDIDIGRGEASHRESRLSRGNGSLVRGEIRHVGDGIVRVRLAMSKYPDRPFACILCPLPGSDDDRAAAISNEAAVEQVQGFSDPARVENIFDGNGIAHHGLLVHRSPFARGYGDL